MIKEFIISGVILTNQPAVSQTLQGIVTQVQIQSSVQEQSLYGSNGISNNHFGKCDQPISQVRVPLKPKLSAIGLRITNYPNNYIYYIDENSDLFGKISVGDRLLTIDGIEANKATREYRNYGRSNTPVIVVIATQDGRLYTMQTLRHPVEYFSQMWQRTANMPR